MCPRFPRPRNIEAEEALSGQRILQPQESPPRRARLIFASLYLDLRLVSRLSSKTSTLRLQRNYRSRATAASKIIDRFSQNMQHCSLKRKNVEQHEVCNYSKISATVPYLPPSVLWARPRMLIGSARALRLGPTEQRMG